MSYRISIVGLGGAGCKIIDRAAANLTDGPTLAAVDTDSKLLRRSHASAKLRIGASCVKGFGTGGDINLGKQAAEGDIESIRNLFADADLAVLVAGLGGGTGTGAAPVILNAARDQGATTICFATLPFKFEGTQRLDKAEQTVAELRESADALIVVPNESLFEHTDKTSADESFKISDEVLSACVSAVWMLIARPGFINLDFADLRNVLQNSGEKCALGYGCGTGKGRIKKALCDLLEGPMLEHGRTLSQAAVLLVGIIGGTDLALKEIGDIMNAVSAKTGEDCRVFIGTAIDSAWRNTIGLMVVASEKWSARTPAVAEARASFNDNGYGSKLRGVSRKGKSEQTQTSLRLDFSGKGRFKNVEPTILGGEDLDIPTFIRRRIAIER